MYGNHTTTTTTTTTNNSNGNNNNTNDNNNSHIAHVIGSLFMVNHSCIMILIQLILLIVVTIIPIASRQSAHARPGSSLTRN